MRCMLFACVVLLVNCLLGVLGCGLLIAFCGFGFDGCAGCMFVGCVGVCCVVVWAGWAVECSVGLYVVSVGFGWGGYFVISC